MADFMDEEAVESEEEVSGKKSIISIIVILRFLNVCVSFRWWGRHSGTEE